MKPFEVPDIRRPMKDKAHITGAEYGLRLNFGGVELDVETGAGGQSDVGVDWNQRIAFKVVVVPHLVDQVLAQGKGHGRLAADDVYGRAQAMAVGNYRHIMQRSDGADARQL